MAVAGDEPDCPVAVAGDEPDCTVALAGKNPDCPAATAHQEPSCPVAMEAAAVDIPGLPVATAVVGDEPDLPQWQ